MLPQRLVQLFCVRKQLEKEGKTPLGRDLEHLSLSLLLKFSLEASSVKRCKAPLLESGLLGVFSRPHAAYSTERRDEMG